MAGDRLFAHKESANRRGNWHLGRPDEADGAGYGETRAVLGLGSGLRDMDASNSLHNIIIRTIFISQRRTGAVGGAGGVGGLFATFHLSHQRFPVLYFFTSGGLEEPHLLFSELFLYHPMIKSLAESLEKVPPLPPLPPRQVDIT